MAHSPFDETNEGIAQLLIDQGADINAGNKDRVTPLHLCVSCANLEMANFLLENGANPNLKGEYDETPLDVVRHIRMLPPHQRRFAKVKEMRALLLKYSAVHALDTDYPTANEQWRRWPAERIASWQSSEGQATDDSVVAESGPPDSN